MYIDDSNWLDVVKTKNCAEQKSARITNIIYYSEKQKAKKIPASYWGF
jgi:hypothetical protein